MQHEDQKNTTDLNTTQLIALLPHRYPMLLVDRLTKIVPGVSAVGIKNVTVNEPFFQGHFPGHPVMPGVLLIEALAQTSGALVMHSIGATRDNHSVYFMSVSDARFRKMVTPGDCLHLHVEKRHQRDQVWRFYGEVFVEGKLVAEATYTAMITKKTQTD